MAVKTKELGFCKDLVRVKCKVIFRYGYTISSIYARMNVTKPRIAWLNRKLKKLEWNLVPDSGVRVCVLPCTPVNGRARTLKGVIECDINIKTMV